MSTLIDNGADINYVDAFWYSLLNYAVKQENCELVKLLIDHGANVNYHCKSWNERTVLEYTVEHKMQYISFLLLMKKYYQDMGRYLPLLYQIIELCFEKVLSKSFMMENIDNINIFTNIITENENWLEDELVEWESYLKSFYFSPELHDLCGFDALKNIVEKATERLTHRITQIEQCSNVHGKSQSLDRKKNFPKENSTQQAQCLLQDENNKEDKSQGKRRFTVGNLKETNSQRTQCLLKDEDDEEDNKKDKSQSRWQLIADNLEGVSSQRAQSQSRWQLIARRLRDLIGFDKSNEVSSRLDQTQSDKVSSRLSQTQVVSKSAVDLLM